MKTRNTKSRSGQTILFLVLVLVILVFVVLWNFDLHKILQVRNVTQNAGDAAALMAARWQGVTLNLVGDLNLMQALALSTGDADTAAAISNIQARLCYVGPMIAFMASQQAAKNNGIFRNPGFEELLREHVRKVRDDYPSQTDSGGEMLFPEPYAGCWEEYADMLELVADEGVAAGPDNVHYYADYAGGHFLLMVDFYGAVAGQSWCWFYHNAPDLLEDYDNYRWWDPLPEIPRAQYVNSEVFGLGLTRRLTTLDRVVAAQALAEAAAERGAETGVANGTNVVAAWYCYSPGHWSSWDAMATDGPDPFPLTGEVRPEYDYTGADAAIRIEAQTARLTPGPGGSAVTNTITWTAASKPFGYLNEADRPDRYGLVLPAFHDVRLIPVDASSAPSGGGYNLGWRKHIEDHLPEYMAHGPGVCDASCWYCRQLLAWEDIAFRQSGIDWLAINSDRCIATGGGGGGGRHGGGSRRGH